MLVNISVKFHEDILNGLKVIELTQLVTETATYKVKRDITLNIYIQELWFLPSAGRLMLVNISMTFHEDILNGFQITERTRFCHSNYLQSSKGHKSNIYISKSYGSCDLHIV